MLKRVHQPATIGYNLLIVILLLVLSATSSWAQRGGGGGGGGFGAGGFGGGGRFGGGEGRNMQALPPIGKLRGIVVDSLSGKPMPYATVTLYRMRDSTVGGGALTNSKGEFLAERIQPGRFRVKVAFLGFASRYFYDVRITPKDPVVNLGRIGMLEATQSTKGVTIEAERPFMRLEVDRKVFDVSQLPVAAGGSASDVMQQIPAVNVDMDGNISMRGSGNVIVLIDGKPSGLTGANRQAILDQIPASTIESIEVITNPTAKYDPDGSAGIINIVLKKNRLIGYTGSVNAGVGTRNKYNGGILMGYREGKWNLSANYGFRYNQRYRYGSSDRTNTFSDTSFALNQSLDGNTFNSNHVGRFSADYNLTEDSKLMAAVTGGYNESKSWETNQFRFNTNGQRLFRSYDRFGTSPDAGRNVSGSLAYSKDFGSRAHNIYVSVDHSQNNNNNNNLFENLEYGLGVRNDSLARQRNQFLTRFNITTAQVDYTRPIGETMKFETGAKTIVRVLDTDFFSETERNGIYTNDVNISNRFVFAEQIHAGYVQVGGKVNGWNWIGGLRGEYSYSVGDQKTTNQQFTRSIPNFFPNLQISRAINERNDIQMSYSRRIDRPGFQSLNPFADYSDPLNLRVGNPNLLPEYNHNLELNHSFNGSGIYVLTGTFFRYTENTTQRIRRVNPDGVSIIQLENLATSMSYGADFIVRNDLGYGWTANSSVSLFNTTVRGNTSQGDLQNSNFAWTAKTLIQGKVWDWFDLQFSANYMAPTVSAQGVFGPFVMADMAIRKDFLDGKANVVLNVNDIFNVTTFRIRSWGPNFNQEGFRKRESQVVNLVFTYRFGNMRDEMRQQRRGGDDGMNSGGGMGGGEF